MRTRITHPVSITFLLLALALSGTAASASGGISAAPPWVVEGWQIYSYFGSKVTAAGDVNGDGISDFLVSAPLYSTPVSSAGSVYLFLGEDGGLSTTPAWTGANNMYLSRFGAAVAPAGDVNNDGYGDVIIGAWSTDFGTGLADQGRAYLYLGSASGLPDTAAWTYAGGVAGARFGFSVCTAGDLDSDGYDDVVVGAPGYDAGSGAVGRVFVFRGAPGGLYSTPAWTYDGDLVDSEFGYAVSTAGDVNGDGFSDFLVGSPGYETFVGPGGGRAYLFTSNAGTPTLNAWLSIGGSYEARHGAALAAAGDVDGDGYADVIVGAPDHGVGGPHPGRAMVFFGTSSGLTNTGAWTLSGSHDGEDLGAAVGPAGDVNGDGYADVMIGSPGYDPATLNRAGRVQVFLGSTMGLAGSPDWETAGTQNLAEFGYSVCTAGDADGDGFGDILIGEWLYDGVELTCGKAYLFWGEADVPSFTPDVTFDGEDGEYLGAAAAAAGDVNADGFGDIIMGSPMWNGPQTDSGRAHLYLGSEFGVFQPPAWTQEGTGLLERYGHAVASAGDVNNDGYGDVLVGAPYLPQTGSESGQAFLYLGSATGLDTVAAWTGSAGPAGSQFGFSVASAGDINNDGFGDVVIGAPFCDIGNGVTGAAFCYYGSASGLDPVPFDTLGGSDTLSRCGYAVASADFNGDGFTDVFVGSPYYSSATLSEVGKAEGFFGSATGLPDSPSWTATEVVAGARCGFSLAGAGDVSNSWCEGILVGAPYYTETYSSEGRVVLYDGQPCPGSIGTVAYKMHQADAHTGWSVSAGDVDGDGFTDVMVGAPHYDQSLTNEGAARLYSGEAQLPNIMVWLDYGGQSYSYLGSVVAVVGDVNGDGFDDILACAPYYDTMGGNSNGRAMLYAGGRAVLDGTDRVLRPRLLATNGDPRQRLGMSDAPDAVRIAARCRGAGGRGLTRLEWNVMEYNSGTVGPIATGAWGITGSAGPGGSFVEQERLIEGLSGSTDYSLRFRVGSRLPYFPHTRWLTIGPTAWAQKHFRTAETQVAVGPGSEAPSPTRPLVRAVYPNPFSAGTAVDFVLPEPGLARLRVFGIDGRLVATLVERELAAGPHIARWDGLDRRGVPAAAGLYFFRLEINGAAHARRALLIR